jgi:hypothetical protein
MTRLAIALATVLLLALSAGSTHTTLYENGMGSTGVAAQIRVAGADQAPAGVPQRSLVANLAASPSVGIAAHGDEQLAPALLVYLVVVLAGSAIAVALVRRGIGREV